MEPKLLPAAETLGQIALIQSMVIHLPDTKHILRFVCRGLLEVPGVDRVDYRLNEAGLNSQPAEGDQASFQKFLIKSEGYDYGELLVYLAEPAAFLPYEPFIINLANMLAVIFEERRQRNLNRSILADLERRVSERTKELELEIKERKLAEKALRESEGNLRITLNSIGDGVISTDTAGCVTRMNMVAESLTGWSQQEAAGQPLTDVFRIIHNQTRQPVKNPVEKVLKAGRVVELTNQTLLLAKDGAEYQIADSGAPIRDDAGRVTGVVLVFRDVTEQQKIEQELLKAKKLESVGILAGGIAHDFNNLLTGLFGNLEMAKLLLPADHKAHEFLESAGRAMDSAVNLTKQLLTFAKGGDPIKETLSLGQVITETAQFSVRGSKARLQFNLAPDLWLVKADKGQLSQVISNLVINAEQAIPAGGTITLAAKNLTTSAGRYVQITVQDDGHGIRPKYLDQIFDPYFTTKDEGSGLGLAITHSIINKHKGRITVDSKLDHGTTFTIHLPAVTETAKSPGQVPATEVEPAAVAAVRILVMDDEELVRKVIGAMLSRLGYDVTFTADGRAAIEAYRTAYENDRPYELVITDLTIPGGMGGQAAAREILKIDPQARIIVSSGYATDPVMANYAAYGFKGIAVKPFRLADLQKEIQRVLGP